ncbi:MAG: VirK/YbjX family protein [Candidatus Thiodiazotropha sp. (ex Lucinoma borealis)]|nr:VirK/YbjX family protein [Candidatus Thiodiazotropha sp. (ex Lucinoma borealis)]MCU7868878.1 VirK/YbjX family protein [Candidatus Thiodiazotropha sp. (ex Lucinoma borealis)]
MSSKVRRYKKVLWILKLIYGAISKVEVSRPYSPLRLGPRQAKVAFFCLGLLYLSKLMEMNQSQRKSFEGLIKDYPETILNIFWPYQCSSWGVLTRIEHLHNHCVTVDRLENKFSLRNRKHIIITELNEVYPGLRIVLDKNRYFLREGLLVINLYIEDSRIFSLAFSFYQYESGEIDAIIGAIQGRKSANIKEIYHDITKQTHGIRPRDLLIEIFQLICSHLGVSKIIAVSNTYRQHRHIYYSLANKEQLIVLNYDEVWQDRGASYYSEEFYKLPAYLIRRTKKEIASKKRSLYKKRYLFLDQLEATLKQYFSL